MSSLPAFIISLFLFIFILTCVLGHYSPIIRIAYNRRKISRRPPTVFLLAQTIPQSTTVTRTGEPRNSITNPEFLFINETEASRTGIILQPPPPYSEIIDKTPENCPPPPSYNDVVNTQENQRS